MTRARTNYWVDIVALASALLVFPTGIILLARFHIGFDGQQRLEWLGFSRDAWIYLHRSAAVAMAAAVAVHAQLHWRAIVQRVYRRSPRKATYSDLALYLGFASVTPLAFAAWLFLPRLFHHPAIDLHNLSGVILLLAIVTHVRRHLRWLLR